MSLQRLLYDVRHATRNLPNVSHADHRTHLRRPLVSVGRTSMIPSCPKKTPLLRRPCSSDFEPSQRPPRKAVGVVTLDRRTTQVLLILCRRTRVPGMPFPVPPNWLVGGKCARRIVRVRYHVSAFPLFATRSFGLTGPYCWCHYCLETRKAWLDWGIGFSRSCRWNFLSTCVEL